MKTDLLIRSTTWGGGCQIAPLVQFHLKTTWILGFPHPVLTWTSAWTLPTAAEAGSSSSPVICSSTARSQSDPPKHAAGTHTDTANEALHLSIILGIRAEVRHFLHFITNTMFHWQQRTAEICHNKNVIMLIYHNNYNKHKGKKVKKLEFPLFPHAWKCFCLDWLLRATWSCPHPDLLLLQQFALERTKA